MGRKKMYIPYRKRSREEQTVPEFLAKFLENLSDKETKELWDFLDGINMCELDMIDVMLDSHPNVVKQNEAR